MASSTSSQPRRTARAEHLSGRTTTSGKQPVDTGNNAPPKSRVERQVPPTFNTTIFHESRDSTASLNPFHNPDKDKFTLPKEERARPAFDWSSAPSTSSSEQSALHQLMRDPASLAKIARAYRVLKARKQQEDEEAAACALSEDDRRSLEETFSCRLSELSIADAGYVGPRVSVAESVASDDTVTQDDYVAGHDLSDFYFDAKLGGA
ncbi:hypothetical protein GLOTRDRAFT_131236 [Gloeophyllum trabeum ATCC 11539]|uniref:Uncharacterized protein n=1 Tax=Gloeophyllum trabeum (strain ATCC 11539 / FP-39264 / Madison 617) TaxID=670483 RepID=S7PZ74_GLOTA|nr:uncharacterized protein GLOTRDRAFT_131236 [Gloeophyllum trabeum ATCC 11539]EPQ52951.1 hypothetical protein GLOTRDRAFT_131236 [Gloeophyllum trabeum ATCC 11539]